MNTVFVEENDIFYLSPQSFEKRALWELVSLLVFAFSKKNCLNLVILQSPDNHTKEPHLPTISWNDVDYDEISHYARAYEEFPDDLFDRICWNEELRDSVYREVFGKNEPLVSHTTEQLEGIINQTINTVVKAFNNVDSTRKNDTILYSDFQEQLHKLHKPTQREDLRAKISFINLAVLGEICIANTPNLSLETLSFACSERDDSVKGFICYGEHEAIISDSLYSLFVEDNSSGYVKVNYGYNVPYNDLPTTITNLINQAK